MLNGVTEVKDVGVIFGCNLNFKQHIRYISNKASRFLSFVLRSANLPKTGNIL